MNRAEMRRMKREQEKAHTVTYNLTQAQLDAIVQEKIGVKIAETKKDVYEETVNTVLALVLTLPLLSNAKYNIGLDELGRVLFLPDQDAASLQPVWTYTDDNSSILYPDMSIEHDIYGIPNVVEVYFSGSHDNYFARVINDDPNSPTSTVNRGREIVHRETDPQFSGEPTDQQVKDYATSLLSQLSSVEYTISYSHGYCPVRLYDCVRLNYERAGLIDVKAKVIRQLIECKPGCKVTETAVFTTNLWR